MQNFRAHAAQIIEWAESYLETLTERPVRSQVAPNDILKQLPATAPRTPQEFEALFKDMENIILPGITHWQHPRFFAYFPANARPESLLADIFLSAMGVNAMLWETSPAATELEAGMIKWLLDAMGLPARWSGVIQDTASSATFAAVITARELATAGKANMTGLGGMPKLAVYVSAEAHSSVEKAARMAGLGSESIRRINLTPSRAMCPKALDTHIQADKANGVVPALLVVTAGGTSTGAFDRADEIISVAKRHGIYTHVDAAWAGSALICRDRRSLFKGVEMADSFVFNPHKWLGVGFDCSVQFLARPDTQISAFRLKPRYLETDVVSDGAYIPADYSDWGPVLGRRMRALKLWFVLRLVGLDALGAMIENHIDWASTLAARVAATPGFKVTTPPSLSLFTFMYRDSSATQELLKRVNASGFTYLTPTLVDGETVIRFQVGSWRTKEQDVQDSWSHIKEVASTL